MRTVIVADARNRRELEALRDFPRDARAAMNMAANRTVSWTYTRLVRAAAAKTGYPQKVVRQRLKRFLRGRGKRSSAYASVWLGKQPELSGQPFSSTGKRALRPGRRYARTVAARTKGGTVRTSSGQVRKMKNYLPVVDVDFWREVSIVVDALFAQRVGERFPVELERAVNQRLRRLGMLE